MKVLRILLIITLVAVAGLYGFSTLSLQLQGSNIGPVISCDTDTLDISVHDDRSVLLQGVTAKDRQDEFALRHTRRFRDENRSRRGALCRCGE